MEEIKVKDDKRRIVCRENLAKARAVKLQKLKEQKELKEQVSRITKNKKYESDSDSDSDESSSSEEELVYKTPKKILKKQKDQSLEKTLMELQTEILMLKNQQAKGKPKTKKKIVLCFLLVRKLV